MVDAYKKLVRRTPEQVEALATLRTNFVDSVRSLAQTCLYPTLTCPRRVGGDRYVVGTAVGGIKCN